MRFLKVIYVMGIAALIIALVIVGIQAFYPGPQYQSCSELLGPRPDDKDSPAYAEWRQECDEIQQAYQKETAVHARNVFLIVLPLGVLFVVVGTFMQRRSGIFGAGLLLGGIGTMIFAVVPRDLDDIPRFIGVAIILAVLIFVGYKVFLSLRRS